MKRFEEDRTYRRLSTSDVDEENELAPVRRQSQAGDADDPEQDEHAGAEQDGQDGNGSYPDPGRARDRGSEGSQV